MINSFIDYGHHVCRWKQLYAQLFRPFLLCSSPMCSVGCIYDPDNVERVKYAYSQGHQVASHGWSHQYLTNLAASQSTYESKYPMSNILSDQTHFCDPCSPHRDGARRPYVYSSLIYNLDFMTTPDVNSVVL
jgi:peptidoglycan/xylan/chitin deacetylase (PgdA/CDA1 family)